MNNQPTKRSLEHSFSLCNKKQRSEDAERKRSDELEHIMFNHYRHDHERQVDLTQQYKKQLQIVNNRADRLYAHGLGMAQTINNQALEIQRLNTIVSKYRVLANMMRETESDDTASTITDEELQDLIDLTTNEELEEELNSITL